MVVPEMNVKGECSRNGCRRGGVQRENDGWGMGGVPTERLGESPLWSLSKWGSEGALPHENCKFYFVLDQMGRQAFTGTGTGAGLGRRVGHCLALALVLLLGFPRDSMRPLPLGAMVWLGLLVCKAPL